MRAADQLLGVENRIGRAVGDTASAAQTQVVDADINDDEARSAALSDTRMKYGGVKRGGHL